MKVGVKGRKKESYPDFTSGENYIRKGAEPPPEIIEGKKDKRRWKE